MPIGRLIANAIRAIHDSFPAAPGFGAGRRAWLAAAAAEQSWRAVAVAAGAVRDHAVLR